MNFIEKKLQKIITKKQFKINTPKIILGLSGGPDSVFLFHSLLQLHQKNQIELICAHLDHGWRVESAQDAKFCHDLCKKHDIKIVHAHAKDLDLELKFDGSQEEIGRKLRRHFFEQVLKQENANFIALAHHLQDQQETFFWRIIRGTTLAGLTAMKEVDGIYIRPLLNTSKKEILDYLDKNNLAYLHDPTNISDQYLRNRIRKYVLPAMQKCDERFNQKFESTLKHLQEEDNFLQKLTKQHFENIFTKNETFVGNLKAFFELDKVLQKRLLIYWLSQENIKFSLSKNYLEEILRFLSSEHGGSHSLGPNWKLFKKQNKFWIKKFNPEFISSKK
jgi:tRNA(Ile)-lysidine synthase